MAETQEATVESQSQPKRKRKRQADTASNFKSKRAKPPADTHSSIGLGIMEHMGTSDALVPEGELSTTGARSSLPRSLNGELVEDPIESVSDPVVGFGNGTTRPESRVIQAQPKVRRKSLFGPAGFSDTSDDEDTEHTENAMASTQVDEAMLTLIDMQGIYTSETEE